jgi:uncharacterized protein
METDDKNRLAAEASPYLQQHARNPVAWYPWGEEAFTRAQNEDKPIFLSIGYSTCHWCHVMAHESFEDPAVAAILNDAFVPVKVDREERPDIDMQYMQVCQMITGSGGWPLTIIMTQQKHPFFAATYIPKEASFGRTGLMDLIPRIKQLWQTRRSELLASAKQITETIRQTTVVSGAELTVADLHQGYQELKAAYDPQWGGFGIAPKFPSPHNLLFLLRYWQRTQEQDALDMVKNTLNCLARGGIQDHIGHGFHRYATDRQWLVPHFEKMLYDQALLIMAFTEAYQATRDENYAHTARQTITYILRDMTHHGGGFYTAEDADSEGEEGKFYLWTMAEIKDTLSKDEASLFFDLFDIREAGNFHPDFGEETRGSNIPHLQRTLEEAGAAKKLSADIVRNTLEEVRQKLFIRREKRIHPFKDDTILTDWNGLMIGALAQAARILDTPAYLAPARQAADFIQKRMAGTDGSLLHSFRTGQASVNGNLDDYAFMIFGLIELYEATYDANYLKQALKLNEFMLAHFWDEGEGGFYFTPDNSRDVISRIKEFYDGAIPSGNSMAAFNLTRLAMITGDITIMKKAAAIWRAFSGSVRQSLPAHTYLLAALDLAAGPSYEIIVVGQTPDPAQSELLRALRSTYLPHQVTIFSSSNDTTGEKNQLAPFIQGMVCIEGKETAYICTNQACQAPLTDPEAMLEILTGHRP